MKRAFSAHLGAKILISLVLGAGMMAEAQVTGSGPGAGAGATDPMDADHNMKPLEPGTPPNPKPADGAITNRPAVTLPARMKRNVKPGVTTTTTTVITTTTIGTFR